MTAVRSALPPGPLNLFGAFSLFGVRHRVLDLFVRWAREYGPVVHYQAGAQHFVLLSDPDLIHNVLVRDADQFSKGRGLQAAKIVLGEGLLTSEGDLHRRQRRLIQPAFHRQRVAAYARDMVANAERMAAEWLEGATVDLHHEMMTLTLRIVAKTLFNADVDRDAHTVGAAITRAMRSIDRVMLPFAEILVKLPLPGAREALAALAALDQVIDRVIAEHRASGDVGDLLSMLLAAQDADGARMSDRQVRDEAMTIFLAGHETTANALTWTFYLLSQHPDVAQTLRAELARTLGGRAPTADDLPNLPYTRMVVAEAMRLYPPAWTIGRRALTEYPLGPYRAPKGSIILISQWVMHRDPRFWPDPERFDPLRWTPEAQAARPRFAYFPFSAGPRICIGESFAWTEAILVLATLAQRWAPRHVPGHVVEPEPLVTLRPKHGMRMILVPA
ncbi:MAG: cytochrome P450 [Dehalococcoidia bacterium]|nr:cytochrome P450 [Dehalococcoidia bacterium]